MAAFIGADHLLVRRSTRWRASLHSRKSPFGWSCIHSPRAFLGSDPPCLKDVDKVDGLDYVIHEARIVARQNGEHLDLFWQPAIFMLLIGQIRQRGFLEAKGARTNFFQQLELFGRQVR